MKIFRYFRLRRRDCIYLIIIWLFSFETLFSALYVTYDAFILRPRYASSIESLYMFSTNAINRSIQAVQSVYDTVNQYPNSSLESTEIDSTSITSDIPVPLSVLGIGQTKSPKRRYIYRDVMYSDGVSRREYLPLDNSQISSK